MPRRTQSLAQKHHAQQEEERLQRIAQAQRLATTLTNGNCAQHGTVWGQAEKDHAAAKTRKTALAAARPALKLCRTCPLAQICHLWAIADHYTGLAAGTSWVDGEPHHPDSTRYQPKPIITKEKAA